MAIQTTKLKIGGMVCLSCEERIGRKLRGLEGVSEVEISYKDGVARIKFDAAKISQEHLTKAVEGLGYSIVSSASSWSAGEKGGASAQPKGEGAGRALGLAFVVLAVYFILRQLGFLNLLSPRTLADESFGFAALFALGVLTSVHCIAMCGGLNISQCLPKEGKSAQTVKPALLYNFGRVASYTLVGFLVGALGSVFSFSSTAQGLLKLAAGVFMLLFGFGVLGVLPKFSLFPRLKLPKVSSPLVVGLLNGLMPCGPLQAMQLYALATGSAFLGAASMFVFALGTTPLMFGLGFASAALGHKFRSKATLAGAVLVAVFGLSMLSQGWTLAGFGNAAPAVSAPQETQEQENADSGNAGTDIEQPDTTNGETPKNRATDGGAVSGDEQEAEQVGDTQVVRSTLERGYYPDITVEEGVPVEWTIDAPSGSINGCNAYMVIPEYGIEYEFEEGENLIEFTPTRTGSFQYRCWMGMLTGTISVI